jgi:Tfp pilus assembly protein PilP
LAQAAPKLGLADNPELAGKLAQEKLAAEEEKKRIEPEENRVTYNSYGRRDPFIPVEQGVTDNGIDIDQMKVVGIIWQSSQPMAVLEHNREAGVSFTVKEGDPVHNGRVARISHEAVTFDISEYGISRSYSLRLVSSSAKEGAKR